MSQKSLDEIKLLIAQKMNETRDEYQKLIKNLDIEIGNTEVGKQAGEMLKSILDAKMELLEELFKEIG